MKIAFFPYDSAPSWCPTVTYPHDSQGQELSIEAGPVSVAPPVAE